jgi:hypothetical protein
MSNKSSKLVDRLRTWNGNSFGPYLSPVPDLLEAANEIERLRAALRAARPCVFNSRSGSWKEVLQLVDATLATPGETPARKGEG